MPGQDDFLRFAAAHARELVRLGHAATGERGAGERLVEEALVEVFPSRQRFEADGELLLAVRRALAAAHSRRRRSIRLPRRVALELRDVRAETGDGQDSAAEPDGRGGLWEALDFLSPRQRLTVALRFAGDLTVGETARVLNRPVLLARRSERQALTELGLAADLPHDSTAPGGGRPEGSHLEQRLKEVWRTRVELPFDPEPLLQRVMERTRHVRQSPARLPVQAVATSALALGGASVVIWSILASGSPDDPGLESRPPSPQGTQLVGYRSIAVAVPASWRLDESPCGRTVADGTVYRQALAGGQCTPAAGGSNVTFADAPLYPSPLQDPPQTASQVAGRLTLRTALTSADGVYEQTLLVPRAMFVIVVTVRSPDQTLVEGIVSSARGVPDGFAIVPACETLPVREAVAALTDAGLTSRISHTSSLSPRHGEPPVTFQNLASGSIVPEGTAVGLTIPSF